MTPDSFSRSRIEEEEYCNISTMKDDDIGHEDKSEKVREPDGRDGRGHQMEQSVLERWNTPEIKKAYEELERMSMDPEVRDLYDRQHKMLTDYFWGLESEYLRGTEEVLV